MENFQIQNLHLGKRKFFQTTTCLRKITNLSVVKTLVEKQTQLIQKQKTQSKQKDRKTKYPKITI